MLLVRVKYQFLILFFISLLSHHASFTQNQINKKALRFQELSVIHFRQGDTINALEFAMQAIRKDSLYATPWVMIGNIYEAQHQRIHAIKAYSKALQIDPDEFPDLFYVLAELELEQKDFENARIHVNRYLSLDRAKGQKKDLALNLLQNINFRELAYAQPVDFIPQNLGEMVNSVHDEYVNSLSTDENSMYITIKQDLGADIYGMVHYSENIYQIKLDSSSWSSPRILSFDSGQEYVAGGASISPNNRYLFFTNCDQNEGYGSCDLNYATIKDGKLGSPKNLGSVVNSSSWDSQPSFSSDGRSLFFASKRNGGYGGSDIWVSALDENGRFQKPYNAGAVINSAGDEMAPYIHYDAKTLYFSSTGHVGIGGYDLFMSRKLENGEWSTPRNLGSPINTSNDEINLIVAPDGESAFISSDQSEGFGGFDIYKFDLNDSVKPSPVTYIQGLIVDSETGEKLEAGVELALLPDGEVFTSSVSDETDGTFLVALPLNKDIALSVEKSGYLMHSEHYNTIEMGTKAEPVHIEIRLRKMNIGEKVVLNNIFFETDKYELMEASFPELKKLVQLMKNNPALVIEISGHTDNVGSKEYNQLLSEKRAKAVYEYLIENQISAKRLLNAGYGEALPVSSNETEVGRAANRRIELKIIDLRY